MDYQDRRKSPRFASRGETILLRLIPAWWPTPAPATPPPEELPAEIIDLSSGGLGVRTARPLEMAQKLRLLSDGREREGIVVWVSRNNTEYRAGIQFL